MAQSLGHNRMARTISPPLTVAHALGRLLPPLGLEIDSIEDIQALWAGYGHIYGVKARSVRTSDATAASKPDWHSEYSVDGKLHLILKLISPPVGMHGDEGHLRKMFSYEVEQYFYQEIVPQLPTNISVATYLASVRDPACTETEQQLTATLLSDLRAKFPIAGGKRALLSQNQTMAAIEWLAKFHASFHAVSSQHRQSFLLPPLEESHRRLAAEVPEKKSLWLNGGYTYLSTRRKEYNALAEDSRSEWSAAFCKADGDLPAVAEMAAEFLTPTGRDFETYIHGDVKSENLFSNEAGTEVAFFDFQYIGLGLGVCDLAKLFTCSVPLDMLAGHSEATPHKLTMQHGERSLLEKYLHIVKSNPSTSPFDYKIEDLIRHWETALVDWCRFQASWGFWGNEEWLQARVRSILTDSGWIRWLRTELQQRRGDGTE